HVVRVARLRHARAREGDGRELDGVEEVRALEVLVALAVAGVDAGRLDLELELAPGGVGRVEGERPGDVVEPAPGVARVHVLDPEDDRRVDRVGLVRLAGPGRGRGCDRRPGEAG